MRRILLTLTAAFFLTFATATNAGAAWVWPVTGKVITPYRNGTDPYAGGQHRGIDIAAPVGTPVRAATAGDVRFAGTAGSSGLTISIRTGDGYDTSYLHLSSLAVRAGTRVSAGERVGAVGTTGTRSATAPHLHFGVRDAGTRHAYHDPLAFLPPPPLPAPKPDSPAPAPAPAPEPVAPVTAPVPIPLPRSAPAPLPRPAPAPVPHPKGAPAPRSLRLADRAPNSAPSMSRLPSPSLFPVPAPGHRTLSRTSQAETLLDPERAGLASRRGGDSARGTQRVLLGEHPAAPSPSGDRRGGTAPTPAAHHAAQLADRRGGGEDARPGPDITWVFACAGLFLAAAILGVTDKSEGRTSRTRARRAGRLSPLVGRR